MAGKISTALSVFPDVSNYVQARNTLTNSIKTRKKHDSIRTNNRQRNNSISEDNCNVENIESNKGESLTNCNAQEDRHNVLLRKSDISNVDRHPGPKIKLSRHLRCEVVKKTEM